MRPRFVVRTETASGSKPISSRNSQTRSCPSTPSRRPAACRCEAFIAHSPGIRPARSRITSGCGGSIIARLFYGIRNRRIGQLAVCAFPGASRAARISRASSSSNSASPQAPIEQLHTTIQPPPAVPGVSLAIYRRRENSSSVAEHSWPPPAAYIRCAVVPPSVH